MKVNISNASQIKEAEGQQEYIPKLLHNHDKHLYLLKIYEE